MVKKYDYVLHAACSTGNTDKPHTLSLSHTHTHFLSLTHTHTLSFSLGLSISISLSHSHSHSHSRVAQYRVIHKLFPKALSSSNLFKATSDAFISQCVIHMARNPVRTVPGQV